MKNQVRNAMAMAIVLMMGLTAAQAQTKVKANIPFDFQVGKAHMAAGQYMLTVDHPELTISGRDQAAVSNTLPGNDKKNAERNECKLVFRRYGDAMQLAEIWAPNLETVRKLPAPKEHATIARNAGSGEGPDEVTVIASLVR